MTYLAREMGSFSDEYLNHFSQHGNSLYTIDYASRQETMQAYSRIATEFVWDHYQVKTCGTGYEMLLRVRPPVDAYSYTYRYMLTRFLLAAVAAHLYQADDWILDVGGGDAWYADRLHDSRVVVLDPSVLANPWVLERPFVRRIQSYGEQLPIKDGSAIMVSCFEVLEHLTDDFQRQLLLKELRRVLRKNGVLLLSTPQVDDLIGLVKVKLLRDSSFEHHGVWTRKRTQRELENAGFVIVKTWGTSLDLKFLNALFARHPTMIVPFHTLNLALELIPVGKSLKFQTIFCCMTAMAAA